MIIRARPKFFKLNDYEEKSKCKFDLKRFELSDDHLFFNTGRSALKFILQCFSEFYRIKVNILMQSFNCSVVADAAIESGANIFLSDIDFDFFSLPYDELLNFKQKCNFLLLTHYQGIPNFDYVKIIDHCIKNNILVIEDMAQTYGSRIDGCLVGTKGDFSIYSYAFDKPFSVYQGGSIKINKPATEFSQFLKNKYTKLAVESDNSARLDLSMFLFLFGYSDKEKYFDEMNNYKLLYALIRNNISENKICTLLKIASKNKFLLKVYNKLMQISTNNKNIQIYKMNQMKIFELIKQFKNFACSDNHYFSEEISTLNLKSIHNSSAEICWNRYSLLDKDNSLKMILTHYGIECGNYNWNAPLHHTFSKHKQVFCHSNLSNSEHASRNILNIPIWHLV